MSKKLLENTFVSVHIVLILLLLSACGGGDNDNNSALSDIQRENSTHTVSDTNTANDTGTTENVQLPEVDSIPTTSLDLSQPLASAVASPTDIVSATVKGLEYSSIDTSSTKNIWKSNSFVSVATHIRYVAPRCKDTAGIDATCGRATNNGLTADTPWDLLSTIDGTQTVPSDTIVWMLPGDYSHPLNDNAGPLDNTVGFEFLLAGEYEKPIHFRPYPGLYAGNNKGVRIDGGIKMSANWVWIWEVEMTSLKPNVVQSSVDFIDYSLFEWRPDTSPKEYYYPGVTKYSEFHASAAVSGQIDNVASDNAKLINVIGHKNAAGFGVWSTARSFEIHGSIMYDNGWIDDWRSHGHGFYVQNNSPIAHVLSDNIVAGNMGNGLQVYASAEHAYKMENVHIIGNVFFAPRHYSINSIKMGRHDSKNIRFEDNFLYGYNIAFPYDSNSAYNTNPTPALHDRTCKNNTFYTGATNIAYDCSTADNEKIKRSNTNDAHVIIRPNKYDPRRANVMVLNPKQSTTFSFSLSTYAKQGDKIVIYNSLNMQEPLSYGTYNGVNATIDWPTQSWDEWGITDTPFGTDLNTKNLESETWALVLFNFGQ